MIHNGATPKITVDPETYAVTADGVLLRDARELVGYMGMPNDDCAATASAASAAAAASSSSSWILYEPAFDAAAAAQGQMPLLVPLPHPYDDMLVDADAVVARVCDGALADWDAAAWLDALSCALARAPRVPTPAAVQVMRAAVLCPKPATKKKKAGGVVAAHKPRAPRSRVRSAPRRRARAADDADDGEADGRSEGDDGVDDGDDGDADASTDADAASEVAAEVQQDAGAEEDDVEADADAEAASDAEADAAESDGDEEDAYPDAHAAESEDDDAGYADAASHEDEDEDEAPAAGTVQPRAPPRSRGRRVRIQE